MPCEWLETDDGVVMHINRGRSGGKKKLCPFCKRRPVSKLCDWPTEPGRTCDAEMCDDCARTLGHQDIKIAPGLTKLGDTWDVCPNHRGLARPPATSTTEAVPQKSYSGQGKFDCK